MSKHVTLVASAALILFAAPAYAQASSEQPASEQDRIAAAIFDTLFGGRSGATASLENQWAAGQTPLSNQRAQFESRVDSQVRTGALNQATAVRLKTDYLELVQLETRYAADRRFTSRERTELADGYGTLTQVLADGTYGDEAVATTAVADGRAQFNSRVDAAVSARRISRAEGRRLKTEYSTVVGVEAGYLGDGRLSDAELADLDVRLDALDARIGDASYAVATPRTRLDAIGRALTSSGLSNSARMQLRVEHEDLSRLEVAYTRLNATPDDWAYLDRRLTELETLARLRG